MFCRFCLEQCGSNFEKLEAVTKELLNILLLELVTAVTEEPVICKRCSENLQKSFEFKSVCLCTEDYINFFEDNKERGSEKLDLMQIYLSKNKNVKFVTIIKDAAVCRLCMELTEPGYYISLNEETEDIASVKTMLGRCLPELNLSTIKNSVICTCCNEFLREYFNFTTSCFDVEQKIKGLCEIWGTSSKKQIKSNSILQFTTTNMLTNSTNINSTEECNEIAIETKFHEYFGEMETQELDVKCEEVDIKINDSEMLKLDSIIDYTVDCTNVKEFHKNKESNKVELNHVGTEIQELHIKQEEIDIKTEKPEITRSKDILSQCDIPKYKIYYKYMNVHKDANEFTCEICKYKTAFRSNFKRHMNVHKDISEVTWYECEICGNYLRSKRGLSSHMLIHKSDSEVKVYQCEICEHKTRHRYHLKIHMMIHKNASEVIWYQCEVCEYKTKYKSHLKRHKLNIHENIN